MIVHECITYRVHDLMKILSLSLNCSTVDTSCTKKEGEAESMTYIMIYSKVGTNKE